MRASVVVGDDFDILVVVSTVQLVLDAKVRKVDVVIEVRQAVVASPGFNFCLVAIGASVAIGSVAIVFLKELLILPLEVDFEHHALDLGTPLAKALLDLAPKVSSTAPPVLTLGAV